MDFHKEIIAELKKKELTARAFAKLKRDLSQKYKLKDIPTNIQILLQCNKEEIKLLKNKLLTKPTRTISGVAPVAIMTKPARCPHGKCIYCVGGINSPWGDVPQSYTGHEPATMRGVRNDYDSYLQVFNRLEQYALLAQNFEKVEIIIMGGTFTSTPKEYQEEFVLGVYKALNDFSELFFEDEFNYIKFKEFFELPGEMRSKERTKNIKRKLLELKSKNNFTLEEEKQRNETSNVKCVALCIETKPDWALLEHGNEMLKQGCTRVELGIQSVYDDVLKFVNRGHDSKVSKKSLQVLRDLGFKVNIHYMPGLPLTDRKRDLEGMKQLFSDPNYRPDMIKIYPCMVAEGTPLYELYKKGKFEAISAEEAASRIFEWKKVVPEYCRIQRIQRDVPTKMWKSGVEMTNLRQFMHNKYEINCRCIRCREPKGKKVNWDGIKIKVMEYSASNGKEYFISAESDDILIGFCRLRFPSVILREEITSTSALIRELHVYGTATALGEEGNVQHKGFGKKLMQKAEEIASVNGKDKMVVISGVGVRGYYKKLGYEKEGPYMVKK
ncbi:MAG: tRNA uridine(34) 5-carboxymethylaminomethyl modification radical SAM/GNAT enzyme Elp3, partial [Flavobacteriales bacterium]|nr:tRNA uridine(34) 5-carboxymethylaminomethyl modification radical SAM/GNAT enzyme Elp3 [Flavobacteriales bacterium]